MNLALLENPNCAETYASFRLVGDRVDPMAITQTLRISPQFACKKGEVYTTRHGNIHEFQRRNGIWRIHSRLDVASTSIERHFIFLLDLLEPKINVIRDFMINFDINAEFNAYWVSATGMGGPTLSSNTLSRMTQFDAYLDFEFQGPFDDE